MAYLNLVWNDLVLGDMFLGFLLGLAAVFVVLACNFRSIRWALVSYVQLLITIVTLYGVMGFVGKDFDMPICVLSSLSLGMAVDFAIHFVARFRSALDDGVDVPEALRWSVSRPGRGILRNALLFAGTFSVMLFASLTPYVTVGAFMVSMMLLAALLTLVCLPALIVVLASWLIGASQREPRPTPAAELELLRGRPAGV